MKSVCPLCRKTDLAVQELDGETLIYDFIKDKAFCLNKTSALVWNACDGTNSISEISQIITKKLNSPANEELIWLAISQLKKENLIANGEEVADNFQGLSRREVIKKAALGTMIALPVISGLIAPTAIHAASACSTLNGACQCPTTTGVGGSCTSASCGLNCSCVTTGCGAFNCIGTCQNQAPAPQATCATPQGACQCPTSTGVGGSCTSASCGANCTCVTTGCGAFNCIGVCQ